MNFKILTGSLTLHILIFFSLILSFEKSDLVKKEVVEITMTEPLAKQELKPSLKKAAVTKAVPDSNKNSVGGLFPRLNILAAVQNNEARFKKAAAHVIGDRVFNKPSTYDTNIDELFGDNGNANWSHYGEVFRKIDSNLSFDSILAQYNHFGKVYVQFQLDSEGYLQMDGLKVDAEDAILKVHVLRALKKSFSEPLALLKNNKADAGILYKARFDFELGLYAQNFEKQAEFGRPVFTFNRYTEERPVPTELLDQLLSGGVTPNISLMYERWQKYNQKKRRSIEEFDPFESYRKDPFYRL